MSEQEIQRYWQQLPRQLARYLGLVVAALVVIYLLTGLFYIEPKQIGVQQRFGKVIDGHVEPGLHFALPAPFDRITLIESKNIRTVDLDDFASEGWSYGSRAQSFIKSTNLKPYCITGDNNIVNVSLLIKYSVVRPERYLLISDDVERLIKGFAASSALEMVAQTGVDEILTFGKKQIENGVKKQLQEQLDRFDSGIGIVFVEIVEIAPPKAVQRYFDDVINAREERKKELNVARALENRVIPDARGYANRIKQEAQSYRSEQVNLAQGESSRFLAQLESVSKNSKVLRKQQYLAFLRRIADRLKGIRVVTRGDDSSVGYSSSSMMAPSSDR